MKFLPLVSLLVVVGCASRPGPIVPETRVEKQMVGLLEKFDRYDLDGNGQLDAKELATAEKSTGHKAAEIIDFYDRDGNGKISLREAQRGFKRVDEAEERAAR
jgi:Ca2+-binding protein (EF-Hand superfamily)